jgi:hypothetical protein
MVFCNAFPTRLTSTGPVKLASRCYQRNPLNPSRVLPPLCVRTAIVPLLLLTRARARARANGEERRTTRPKEEEEEEVRRCRLAWGSAARRCPSSARFLSAFRRRSFISSCFELRDEGPPAVGAPEAAAGQSSSSSFVIEREQQQSSSSGGRSDGGDDETERTRPEAPGPEQQQLQRPPARAAVVFVEGEAWMPPRGGPAPRSPRL